MRYRKLDENGDYTFGSGQLDFYIDEPAAVAQACMTGLLLWQGEWYLDLDDGTPYAEGVLGKHSQDQADATLNARLEQIQGVQNVVNFTSAYDANLRKYTVTGGNVNTIYGVTAIQVQNYGNL